MRAGKPAPQRCCVAGALAPASSGACGSDDSGDVDPGDSADAPDYEPALAKAPAELSALYAERRRH